MSEQPSVTVLMAVWNDAAFVSQAVESILRQGFDNFEFLVIDDGSTDATRDLLTLAAAGDRRMRIFRNNENIGQSRSLKAGLELARGQYVARMDADDIALPARLGKQVAVLDSHPEIGIVGSACRLIDPEGRDVGMYPVPTTDLAIRWTSLLANPFAHPTVMIRRDVLTENNLNYNETFQTAQDYDLWTRMLKYTRATNIGEPLNQYRVRCGVTSRHREIQLQNHDRIALRTIQEGVPGFAISLEQVSQLRGLFVGGNDSMPDLDSKRMALAEMYLDLFMAFASCHLGEPELKALQRREALKVAQIVLRAPLRPRWMRVVGRLLIMHPELPWSLLRYVPKAGRRWFKRFLEMGVRQHKH